MENETKKEELIRRAKEVGMEYLANHLSSLKDDDDFDMYERGIVGEEKYRNEQGDAIKRGFDERVNDVLEGKEETSHPDSAAIKVVEAPAPIEAPKPEPVSVEEKSVKVSGDKNNLRNILFGNK